MYGRVEIDDETKKKLSLLLKYYRKKANLNQRDFITYNGATICSADTYSKIENCKIIKSNSIYHYLLVQIHAELNLPSSWWEPWSTCFQEQDWQSGVPPFSHSSGKKPISLRLSIENC